MKPNKNTIPQMILDLMDDGVDVIDFEEISFGIRLKELLKEKDMTIKDLSRETNTPYNTAWNWVEGDVKANRLRQNTLEKLSDFFDVDSDYLLCKQVERRKSDSSKLRERLKSMYEEEKIEADKYYNGDVTAYRRGENPLYKTDSFINIVNHTNESIKIGYCIVDDSVYDTAQSIYHPPGDKYYLLTERIEYREKEEMFFTVIIDGKPYSMSTEDFNSLKAEVASYARYVVEKWVSNQKEQKK